MKMYAYKKAAPAWVTMQPPTERIAHELDACYDELRRLGVHVGQLPANKNLIISTGDISDVDGFFALAKYAMTGADVLFVMNYPAWVGCDRVDKKLANGLGYTYTCNEFMQRNFEENCEAFKGRKLSAIENNTRLSEDEKNERKTQTEDVCNETRDEYIKAAVKLGLNVQTSGFHANTFDCMQAFDRIAFTFAHKVWDGTVMPGKRKKGVLYYCRGGVNSTSPFALPNNKNEIVVYAQQINEPDMMNPLGLTVGAILKPGEVSEAVYNSNSSFKATDCTQISTFLERYESICMDFNGSMAFLDSTWISALDTVTSQRKLKAVFVMGGCLTTAAFVTLKLPFLNRMSCATMNQLYHPGRTAQFFDFIAMKGVPVYVVSNNVVQGIPKDEDGSDNPIGFLRANGIHCTFLESITSSYYGSQYFPGGDKNPFDLYTAVAVESFLNGTFNTWNASDKLMWYDSIYGCTLLSDKDAIQQDAVTQTADRLGNAWEKELVQRLQLVSMRVHTLDFTHIDNVLKVV
jgi:hypothetical protein